MASGVGVHDDCVTAFNELKLKHNMKYIIYKMNDAKTVINVLKKGEKTATYQDFVKELPSSECRYGCVDFEYTDPKTGGQRNKIVFLAWCPDNCGVREKMIYASSKDELKKRLVGFAVEHQACDSGDLEEAQVLEKVTRV